MKLTLKQERFCYEYCIDLNATQAAIRAGFKEETAYSQGCRLLKNVEIQSHIKAMQDNVAKTAGITLLKVLNEHHKIAFSSIANLHQTWIEKTDFEKLSDEQKACIKSISTKVLKQNIGTKDSPEIIDVEYVKVELYDKQKSLDSISRLLGFGTPNELELKTNDKSITIIWKEKRYGSDEETE